MRKRGKVGWEADGEVNACKWVGTYNQTASLSPTIDQVSEMSTLFNEQIGHYSKATADVHKKSRLFFYRSLKDDEDEDEDEEDEDEDDTYYN